MSTGPEARMPPGAYVNGMLMTIGLVARAKRDIDIERMVAFAKHQTELGPPPPGTTVSAEMLARQKIESRTALTMLEAMRDLVVAQEAWKAENDKTTALAIKEQGLAGAQATQASAKGVAERAMRDELGNDGSLN